MPENEVKRGVLVAALGAAVSLGTTGIAPASPISSSNQNGCNAQQKQQATAQANRAARARRVAAQQNNRSNQAAAAARRCAA